MTTDLEQTVVARGFCIGCGACAVAPQSPMRIVMNDNGQYEAVATPVDENDQDLRSVCPFSDTAINEDEIGRSIFGDGCEYVMNIGYFHKVHAGHVIEGDFRDRGSSGGFGSWITSELIKKGLVDFVLHVKESPSSAPSGSPLFEYAVSSNVEEVRSGSKSRYYPVHMASVLRHVREHEGRYAIVGLPCFIKSVRLLQESDVLLAERVKYCIGLVCGHLKSSMYAENLAWQMGIPPGELRTIDFRVKDTSARADRYCIEASDGTKKVSRPVRDLFGTDWGAGAFKYKACDFCDDVFAETADLVIGDAWLPEFVDDPQGTSIIVTRRKELSDLIASASKENRIEVRSLTASEAIASQAGGLRHRRDAISYRLAKERKTGGWVPPKRLRASSALFSSFDRVRQNIRTEYRNESHRMHRIARDSGDIQTYLAAMDVIYGRYKKLRAGLVDRVTGAVRRALRNIP
ncbi:Coenzyme F420 hydrogenase/dehydrogenase, beta subunit C-terminal domain [Mesorhizobium sp.]|uniref:Coenzyme F420 hydrogenase/dehydrogenase, beta subunit C-terminal domain n=1 Tax=Mesorhizobium sp. TaxID=1871066 RepID=UPI00122891EF|nr:Coenzyme F420 hydrogenase/dehydrogenase, beta subunit C-terminal domain [Mesorhizobium sp.]TIN26422.1 MAG: coenzyme F420 hydrogenase [Mesorhizobium sp.]